MKTRLYTLAFIVSLHFCSCQKEISFETQRTEPIETSYRPFGTWDETGKPNYLLTRDAISANFFSFINANFEEGNDLRLTNPDIYDKSVNIDILEPSDVFVSFVSQSTSLTDAIGFYTYPTNNPPSDLNKMGSISYIFPNAGQGTSLKAGDKVKLGRFNTGVSIGLVLLQNGWNSSTQEIDQNVAHFCTNDILNPESDPNLKKHTILLNYNPENKLVVGFEDLQRTDPACDHDFQDVLVYLTIVP